MYSLLNQSTYTKRTFCQNKVVSQFFLLLVAESLASPSGSINLMIYYFLLRYLPSAIPFQLPCKETIFPFQQWSVIVKMKILMRKKWWYKRNRIAEASTFLPVEINSKWNLVNAIISYGSSQLNSFYYSLTSRWNLLLEKLHKNTKCEAKF